MSSYEVRVSSLHGTVWVPPSKSHSVRAVFYAALADGCSQLSGLLDSPDVDAMKRAVLALGATVEGECFTGIAGRPRAPADVIDVGNSGLTLRLIGAIAGLIDGYTQLTGDLSIRSRRPAQPLLDGLNQLGAVATSQYGNGLAPLEIRGRTRPGRAHVDGQDSQPVSALLSLAALMDGTTELEVAHPGERPWVDLTLAWLKRLGVSISRNGYSTYTVKGGPPWRGFSYSPPADFSSAAFPIGAAIATNSTVQIGRLDFQDEQGDLKLIPLLQRMGVPMRISGSMLIVEGRGSLKGQEIDMDAFIDALPILAVLGCLAEGETRLRNAEIARRKESDRIAAICKELRKMNADIEELPDGLIARHSQLRGAEVEGHDDHRIALALTVAGLAASGSTLVKGIACVSKTFPNFHSIMGAAGARIQLR